MLQKSVLINLSIGYGDFSKAMGAVLIGWIISIICIMTNNPAGSLLIAVGALAGLVYCIRGMNKIFNTSLFSETGAFYMVLPLSSRELALGKILAAAFFNFGCTMIFFLMSVLAVLLCGIDAAQIGDMMFSDYLSTELPPDAIALLIGLFPLKSLLQELAFCAFAMAVLLAFNLLKPNRRNGILWLVIFAADWMISKGLSLLTNLLIQSGFNRFVLEGLVDFFYVSVFLLLLAYCVKALRTKYNI